MRLYVWCDVRLHVWNDVKLYVWSHMRLYVWYDVRLYVWCDCHCSRRSQLIALIERKSFRRRKFSRQRV